MKLFLCFKTGHETNFIFMLLTKASYYYIQSTYAFEFIVIFGVFFYHKTNL